MKRLLSSVLLACACAAAGAAERPWVTRSNELATTLTAAQGAFQPESLAFFGVPGYDTEVSDLKPKFGERYRAALTAAKATLQKDLAAERDPNVRQDLEIMIAAAQQNIDTSALNEKYLLPWFDIPQTVWFGLQAGLREDASDEKRAAAKTRLERYVGLAAGSESLFAQAKARWAEAQSDAALMGPVKLEVEQAITNAPTFAKGLRELFAARKIEGADAALTALDAQTADFVAWARATVLPKTRTDFKLPRDLYAQRLVEIGIDIAPETLIERAQLEFMETRAAMAALAPQVAKQHGIADTDYRAVIRTLKRKQIDAKAIEAHYRKINTELEKKIAEHGVVDLPKRAMLMRVASAAETAAQPAPHMQPPPMVGNTGQQGAFVLPLGNPAAGGEQYDDFSFDAVSWTLSAHEGRPGHELQFSAMIERGVSMARSLFAFNSVNAEGWALYAEAEMLPYEPLDGQLFALQFRLLRAARAMLDPMLNLGLIDRERAGKLLTDEVMLSPAMTRQELDRYTFNSPGQAGAYFYGYARINQLRMETELALGAAFDRLAFNNFLLDQGLLPPGLLAKAVREEFVPQRRK